MHLINHGLGVTIGFMCIWSGGESPLIIISLRGTCDQRKADINWRTVPEWGGGSGCSWLVSDGGSQWERWEAGGPVSVGSGGVGSSFEQAGWRV